MDRNPTDIECRAYQAGISIRKLTARAGVAQSTFNRWKKGSKPHPFTVSKIVRALEQIEAAQ